jgi:transposase
LGLFIIATNNISNELTMEQLLSHYKSQQFVEKGFLFLKSPDFLTRSIYLNKPMRIEALLMVMTSCLMVYVALEHQIRKTLKKKACYFPDRKKSLGRTPPHGGYSNATRISLYCINWRQSHFTASVLNFSHKTSWSHT